MHPYGVKAVGKPWESADKTVRKTVIKMNKYGPWEDISTAIEGSMVQLEIEATCLNGVSVRDLKDEFGSKILDGSSEKVLVIGESCCELDRQIERAIQMMYPTEKSQITVFMRTETTEQQVSISFIATLMHLKPFKPIWEWTPEEKYQIALNYKEMGVTLYKETKFVDAFHKFSRACKIIITLEPIGDLDLGKEAEQKLSDLRLILYNNMAGCQLNCKNNEYVVSLCDKVLNKDENNVKALYRRGMAYGNLNNVEKAFADFKHILTLQPQNARAKEQYKIYNVKVQEANQKCNDMVKRMFKT